MCDTDNSRDITSLSRVVKTLRYEMRIAAGVYLILLACAQLYPRAVLYKVRVYTVTTREHKLCNITASTAFKRAK